MILVLLTSVLCVRPCTCGLQDKFEWIGNALAQYQDPVKVDSLTKVQAELDLTKEVMVRAG